ncbi:MAG: hypothetical protein Q7R83_03155 [bacterium]|nr:hypothetical protein [bacterium]
MVGGLNDEAPFDIVRILSMWIWVLLAAALFLAAAIFYRSFLSDVIEEDEPFLMITAVLLIGFFIVGFFLTRLIPEPGHARVSSFKEAGKATVEKYLNNKR